MSSYCRRCGHFWVLMQLARAGQLGNFCSSFELFGLCQPSRPYDKKWWCNRRRRTPLPSAWDA